jgi:hypothetical protein
MNLTPLPIELAQYFLMNLVAQTDARGVLFVTRQQNHFGLIPYFPAQPLLAGERALYSRGEVVEALFGLGSRQWETIARLDIGYTTARTKRTFWSETLDLLAELDRVRPVCDRLAAQAPARLPARPPSPAPVR